MIGLALFNQASLLWTAGKLHQALELYEQATPFMPDDPLLKMLLGVSHLYAGSRGKGRMLLKEIAGKPFPWAFAAERLPQDILEGNTDEEGVLAIFLSVDERRDSILAKQKKLQATLRKYPRSRTVLFQLAVSHLQLGKKREAHEALARYHALDPHDPLAEYYLAALSLERHDLVAGWRHLKVAESLTSKESPVLRQLRNALLHQCPEL